MSDLQDDFQATVEDIAQDAREIERIEREKAKLDPADPETRSLSARAEEIGEQLHQKTRVEQDLAETAAGEN
ncbi:MAG: hypothetical protein WEE50_02255 [Chloroflexota bacterium]